MTKLLERIFAHVRELPEEEQEKAATAFMTYLDAARDIDVQISDEQLAEVRRRRAETDPPWLSHEEFRDSLRRFGI